MNGNSSSPTFKSNNDWFQDSVDKFLDVDVIPNNNDVDLNFFDFLNNDDEISTL